MKTSSLHRMLILLLFVFGFGCGKNSSSQKELSLYIWSDYLSQGIIDEFTHQTGIAVHVDTYESNEALLEKLQSGVARYDLVVPSDYMVRILIASNLLMPIDRDQVPNFSHLESRFLKLPFDPENRFSVPYLWGTTGFAYNIEKIHGNPDSWDTLFDPAYRGRIVMLNDVRECFAVALKRAGQSLNSTDEAVLKQASEDLMKQKPLVLAYDSEDFANKLAAGDVDLSHGYNGQFVKMMRENPGKFRYVIPKEGGTLWMDNLCIPKNAEHAGQALAFMNYLQEPAVAAKVVQSVHYASPNGDAKSLLPADILNDPVIYPPESTLSKCEFIRDIGNTATLLDRYWTELKVK